MKNKIVRKNCRMATVIGYASTGCGDLTRLTLVAAVALVAVIACAGGAAGATWSVDGDAGAGVDFAAVYETQVRK